MEGSADCAPALAPHAGADCERDLASTCFAWRQLCKCDHCDEEWPLIDMAQWEYKAWETGVSWCRRCFNSLQFKTERNNGPRVSAKKKQGDVNAGMRTIAEQLPISWTECMATIDAAFPDPAETCKYLQNDTKRVPRSAVTKSCTLVAICDADAAALQATPTPLSLGPPVDAERVRGAADVATASVDAQRPIEGDDSATTAPRANAAPATGGHVFAQDLQDVCKGEAVPPDAVAVMRSSDGRNGSSKKQPYLAFLVPERGRYLWMRSWEAWGLRKCSLCEYERPYRFFRLNTLNYYGTDACARFKSQCDCCEPLYMRFHIKEKKDQDEIKALVQSKDIDATKGLRHPVHFDQEEEESGYRAGVAAGTVQAGLGPFGLTQKAKASTEAALASTRRPRPSKADEDGLKTCQFCERKKALSRFPMRLIMTCRGQAERKLGAHCKKCMIRSAHLRSNGYMRPHAQDLIKSYHQAKVNSERFSGNESGSEEYEVDDHGQAEQQMKDLGVSVTMHPAMLEDLAIQSAASRGGAGPSSSHEPCATHVSLPTQRSDSVNMTCGTQDAAALAPPLGPGADFAELLQGATVGAQPAGAAPALPRLGLLGFGTVPAGLQIDPPAMLSATTPAEQLLQPALHEAQLGADAPHSADAVCGVMQPYATAQPTHTNSNAVGTPCEQGLAQQAHQAFSQRAGRVLHAAQPDTAGNAGGGAQRAGSGDLPRIMLRPRRPAQKDDDPDYVTYSDGDASPVSTSPRRKAPRRAPQAHVSLRCDTLHNTLVQAHNAGAFQSTLASLGPRPTVRGVLNTAMPLQHNAAQRHVEGAFRAGPARGGDFGAALRFFSGRAERALTLEEQDVACLSTRGAAPSSDAPLLERAHSHPREASLLAAVAHATERQASAERAEQQASERGSSGGLGLRTRTRPVRPPPRTQDMVSLDEDDDVAEYVTPPPAVDEPPLRWACKRLRTMRRESDSLTCVPPDTLSDKEEVIGVEGLLGLAKSTNAAMAALNKGGYKLAPLFDLAPEAASGMLPMPPVKVLPPPLQLPAAPGPGWHARLAMASGLGTANSRAELDKLLSTYQQRSTPTQ